MKNLEKLSNNNMRDLERWRKQATAVNQHEAKRKLSERINYILNLTQVSDVVPCITDCIVRISGCEMLWILMFHERPKAVNLVFASLVTSEPPFLVEI